MLASSGADARLIESASVLATLAEAQLALDKRSEATRSLQAARKRLESARTDLAETFVVRARIDLLFSRVGETSAAPTVDRAVDLLLRAVAMGYRDVDLVRVGSSVNSQQ